MRIRVGCRFDYRAERPTPAVWQVRPRLDGPHAVVVSSWGAAPYLPSRSYLDLYGNLCDRLTLEEGETCVRYDALVEVPGDFDDSDKGAVQHPVESLPDDTLIYLLPSRYCAPELVAEQAWDLFGTTPAGWERAQAVCEWTHHNLRYQVGSSTADTAAIDALQAGAGVCRDFTQVGITLCRALNIPARYVSGYLPDIAVPPPDLPMDFCSWYEAYLDGRWWTFDPRNNVARVGRVVIGRGRDAADVAMVTTYGPAVLSAMTVWADEVEPGLAQLAGQEGP